VVTLAAVHTPYGLPVTATVAAAMGTSITFAAPLLAINVGSRLDRNMQATIIRFMRLMFCKHPWMLSVLTGVKAS
jgi:hypothetical protein